MIPEDKARHWRALALAREAIELGARVAVASVFTGLPKLEVQRLFCARRAGGRSTGRVPWSAYWYVTAAVFVEIHAAFFYACFRTLRELGHPPAEALVAAYKNYARHFGHDLRLSFDRAFELVAHVDGLWTTEAPRLTTVVCHGCKASYIAPRGDEPVGTGECPFCKVVRIGNGRLLKLLMPAGALDAEDGLAINSCKLPTGVSRRKRDGEGEGQGRPQGHGR